MHSVSAQRRRALWLKYRVKFFLFFSFLEPGVKDQAHLRAGSDLFTAHDCTENQQQQQLLGWSTQARGKVESRASK